MLLKTHAKCAICSRGHSLRHHRKILTGYFQQTNAVESSSSPCPRSENVNKIQKACWKGSNWLFHIHPCYSRQGQVEASVAMVHRRITCSQKTMHFFLSELFLRQSISALLCQELLVLLSGFILPTAVEQAEPTLRHMPLCREESCDCHGESAHDHCKRSRSG